VAHLFNHQTHHREQVTALLTRQGIDPGSTDLIAMLREDAARGLLGAVGADDDGERRGLHRARRVVGAALPRSTFLGPEAGGDAGFEGEAFSGASVDDEGVLKAEQIDLSQGFAART
jgi:hypothetical protein